MTALGGKADVQVHREVCGRLGFSLEAILWSSSAIISSASALAVASGVLLEGRDLGLVIAVADPDEWDDSPHDPGLYNTFLKKPQHLRL